MMHDLHVDKVHSARNKAPTRPSLACKEEEAVLYKDHMDLELSVDMTKNHLPKMTKIYLTMDSSIDKTIALYADSCHGHSS